MSGADGLSDSAFLKDTKAFKEQLYAEVPEIELSENSRSILSKRYLCRDEVGNPTETVRDMLFRVASTVGSRKNDGDRTRYLFDYIIRDNYKMLSSKKFFPNSPTFTGAGTPLGQLAACFVLPIVDDMGRDPAGIMSTLRNAALIQQTGGGNGFSFSRLRQKGAFVKSSGGTSSGPVGFMKVYDQAFGMIAQGGTRRGANMAVLRVDHPDIEEFIKCKAEEGSIKNFNISVGITDAFMTAVRDGTSFDLIAPHTKVVVRTVDARVLFDLIVKYAFHNGEPGVLFLDAANRKNPVPHLYELEATNPCGEQWLGPYENCCLGSINLAKHLLPGGTLDWEELRITTEKATIFLDDVVDVNSYVDEVSQLRKAAMACRRIGLGIMGLADAMYHVGVRYGSRESEEFGGQVMEFVNYHTMLTSIWLSKVRGPFEAIKGSIYDKDDLKWSPPTPLGGAHSVNYGRPELDWDKIVDGILKHGIRNACVNTIAPTGTIATVAGCEGYGCEPVFALAYYRHVNDNGKDLRLTYVSPSFEKALDDACVTGEVRKKIIDEVVLTGSCQGIPEVPKRIRDVFVVSADITPKEHVRLQASLQAFVDNSLSKTCNLPSDATQADVYACYMLAWELGCKGLTVYVTGSRKVVVLETAGEAAKKLQEGATTPEAKLSPLNLVPKKIRPSMLTGITRMIDTPVGKAFITFSADSEGNPFETFINTSKAGSETAAVSEAFGRLISFILRVTSPIPPKDRLKAVMEQMSGIGGRRARGLGPKKVLSLPDGIAKAIQDYLNVTAAEVFKDDMRSLTASMDSLEVVAPTETACPQEVGDLCPDCGYSSLINEEGCKKCYSDGCGYSEC